jgi:hypothetical protein
MSSTRTGASFPFAPPGTCPGEDDHSSAVYCSSSKYAAENTATTRSARASASFMAVMKLWAAVVISAA